MRRAVPSFTVEVRRRPRLATTSSPNVQSPETNPPQAAFDRESHRAAAAVFGAKKVDHSPVEVAASHPMGRILQSLVPDEPLRRPLRDASLSAAESDPPSRAPKRPSFRDQTSNRRGTRDSRLPRARRWRSACRPHPVSRPARNQMKGQAVRQGTRRLRQVKLLETSAVWRCAQRQNSETKCQSLANTGEPRLCSTASGPRQ